MTELIKFVIIKNLYLNIINSVVFLKIDDKHIDIKTLLKTIIGGIIINTVYIYLNETIWYKVQWIPIVIEFILQVIMYKIILRNEIKSTITKNMISNAIVYIGLVATMFVEYPVMHFISKNEFFNLFAVMIIETLLIFGFFKIKRFKRGFAFVKSKIDNDYIDIAMINISALVILAYSLFDNYYGDVTKQILFTFIAVGIIMIIMIQKTLTLYYKQKLLQQNIESYKEEIKEKDEKIKELSDEKFKISKLNHEFYNRQRALELKVEEFINNANMEASEELSIIDQIKNMTDEYSTKQQEINNVSSLPKTGITEIDDMFAYMQSECNKNKIEFILKINGNIYHLINNIIAKDRLVTLIGDHLRDAIIAINNSSNTYRSIMAILGMKDNTYEFRVYDTGIEFEIETLLKLGLEPATTHKDQGGTGIGFITTFETLKETKASLVIEENHPENDKDYTKCVSIKFDGKNEYKIISYRADKIKAEAKDNRIIIKKL